MIDEEYEEEPEHTPTVFLDQVMADEATAVTLRQIAALAGEYNDALKACGISDAVAAMLIRDWHAWLLENDGFLTTLEEIEE